ncbi:MAG TPA: DUF58 domain-containing protein [Chthoniobacteraceae bacterium]|jgi:uncharacterized protein (DUF58 family)|nr:DUF58 domain-containing protein [Chthoniobacteraceae bacterium]
MVPRTRLIIWTALIVLPLSVYATVSPVAYAGIGAFFLLVLFDAVTGSSRLRGLRIELPALTRLQKDRAGTFEVHIHNEHGLARMLRLAIPFPPEFQRTDEERLVEVPAGITHSRIEWSCLPVRRGEYWLRHVYLETPSALGFWGMRTGQKVESELRVYPNMQDERKHVAALFLRRGQLGVHAQRLTGQGRDFEKLREYIAGDSLSDIHWKASARRGSPVTKIYQVERTHEVYVLVDTSRLSARPVEPAEPGGLPATAIERYVSAALLLALAAEQQGDQFGLITFSDRIHSFVRARTGPAHLDACRDRLYSLQPHDVSPDFEELFTTVRLRLRKRALLIILTSLDDPVLAESFVKATDLVARQHLLLVNMLRPPGVESLFTKPAAAVDDIYQALAGHLQWQKLRELQLGLRRHAIRLSFIDPAALAAEVIAQHAEVRARSLV